MIVNKKKVMNDFSKFDVGDKVRVQNAGKDNGYYLVTSKEKGKMGVVKSKKLTDSIRRVLYG